jgi:4-amino-4-deoxy-L-arabinose transferase-like glycosyltransferase
MFNQSYWFNRQYFITGEHHHFNVVWLFIMASSLILIGLGLRDPWPADEPRFAEIAKEMVETGQWFFPMRGGELYPDKPPIFMWSIALFYQLFGHINIAFLLPNAICSLVTVFAVYDLGKRYWSPQVGWRAALLLLVSLQFTLQAKTAQIDAMVCCWITLGCYGILRHILDNGNWTWFAVAGFFMGIGVITKGVGFLPIFMLLPYLFVRIKQPQPNEISGGWRWGLIVVMLFAAIMLWFVPMLYWVEQSQNPLFESYRDNILFKQTAKRYAHSWHHIKPFWYYFVSVVPIFWLPISALLPWLITPWKQAWQRADRRIILPLVWIILVLMFFSLSPGKRGVYILPALPMLALITAPYLPDLWRQKWPHRILYGVVAMLSVIFLSIAIAGILQLSFAHRIALQYGIEPWHFLASIGTAGLVSLVIFRRIKALSWIGFIVPFWLLYSTWGYQLLNPVKTPKNIFDAMSTVAPANAQLGIVGLKEQFLLFTRYPTTHFGYHTPEPLQFASAWHWQQSANQYVLSYQQAELACYDADKAIVLGQAHSETWVLYPLTAKLATCDAQTDDLLPGFYYQPKQILQ